MSDTLIYQDYLKHLLSSEDKILEPLNLEEGQLKEHLPGIIQYTPHNPSENLLPMALSCGLHGNETAPIEILNDILSDIAQNKLLAKRETLFIFGNPKAMKIQERFVDFNMNRLFSGNHQNYSELPEAQRAQKIETIVTKFFKKTKNAWHFDLHTAMRKSHHLRFAVYPHQEKSEPDNEEVNLLNQMGVQAVLLSHKGNTTFSYFTSSQCGCRSYTIELGKVEPFGQNTRENFKEAENTLRSLLNEEISDREPEEHPLYYQVVHEMIRDCESYELHLPEDYANFTPIPAGSPLETTQEGTLEAEHGDAVVFPNSKVEVGQRAGLVVRPKAFEE